MLDNYRTNEFSHYRRNDYVTPRTMNQAFGPYAEIDSDGGSKAEKITMVVIAVGLVVIDVALTLAVIFK